PASWGSSWASTSARRTGSCASRGALPSGPRTIGFPLDPEVPEVALDIGLDSGEAGAPASGLPDLEVVRVADDDGLSRKRRVLAEMRRDRDSPLAIRVGGVGASQHEVPKPGHRRVGPRALCDFGVQALPLRRREDGKAFTYPTRHDRSFFEAASELGGDGEPTLLVQRVGEFACEIAFQVSFRLRETVPHRPPLLTTRREFTPPEAAVNRRRRSVSRKGERAREIRGNPPGGAGAEAERL